jgi:type IV pilus assembly protein PilC
MPNFHYKIKNIEGNLEEGQSEAQDRFALSTELRGGGKTVISIEEINEKKGIFKGKQIVLFRRVKLHEKILFARNLSTMIEAGLPLSRALNVLERQTKNLGFKEIIKDVGEGIAKGSSLSMSFGKHPKVFSSLEVSMVHVGEESGNLAKALNVVASQLEKSYDLHKKLKSAMMYPAIIMIIMVIIGALMLVFVVPTLTATFKDVGATLPKSTQFVIAMSDLLRDHGLLFLAGLGLFVFSIVSFGKTKKGKQSFDFIALHVPLISTIVKEYNTAQTTRSLSSLLSSGVGVVETITITMDVIQNSYYKEVLKGSIEDVQKGVPLSEAFVRGQGKLYPLIAGEMIQVGEETGQLSNMLEKVAIYYEDEVNTKTKDMSTIIEPFLMVIIGAGVGFFAVSMLSPMYSLVDAI